MIMIMVYNGLLWFLIMVYFILWFQMWHFDTIPPKRKQTQP